jgi:enolase
VLVDGDERRYEGKGMLKAVTNIEEEIGSMVTGMEVEEIKKIDEKMIELDGTENKGRLGGNAMLAVSLAVARAGAMDRKMALYKYLRQVYEIKDDSWKLPRPMVVMIEGGKHADKTTDIQEYLIADLENQNVADDIRMEMEIYMALKKILRREGLSTNVGNEGAFAPSGVVSNEKPLEYLVEAIEMAGYRAGKDAGLALDPAASEFFREGKYEVKLEGKNLNSREMIEMYKRWAEKYPIVSIEDGLAEDDWENWAEMSRQMQKMTIIADDLTVTNLKRWEKAIETKAANAILIKLNQAGTLSETMECCLLAREKGLITVPSHRGGGETNDTFMVDLAVAVGSEYIKVGPTRGERVEKYNRLMEIERELKA